MRICIYDNDKYSGRFERRTYMRWFQSFPSAVQFPSASLETRDTLLRDCELCFNAKQTSESYSSGSTFFLRASETPKCTLERLAREIFEHHTQSLTNMDRGSSGAEWWVLRIDPHDDVGFHWDRDYGLEEKGELKYPMLGTVTYISAVGGATIVTGLQGAEGRPRDIDGDEFNEYAVSRVLPYKHIAFRGDLLHGAPSDIYEDQGEDEETVDVPPRITFLVNIWVNHIPEQPGRLSYKMHGRLSSLPPSEVFMSFTKVDPIEVSAEDCPVGTSNYQGDLIQDEKCYKLSFYLLPQLEFERALETADSMIISSSGGIGKVKIQMPPANSGAAVSKSTQRLSSSRQKRGGRNSHGLKKKQKRYRR